MNDTALMVELLRRLKKETNGAVVEAMEQRGIHYPLSYGVAAHTVKKVAEEYGTRHSLAMLLFDQQIRELKLAAIYIADPTEMTPESATRWAQGLTPELAGHAAATLFCHIPHIATTASTWIASDDQQLQYMALLALGRTLSTKGCPPIQSEILEKTTKRIFLLVTQRLDDMYLAQTATFFLVRFARISSEVCAYVRSFINRLCVTPGPSAAHIAEETGWQLDYL